MISFTLHSTRSEHSYKHRLWLAAVPQTTKAQTLSCEVSRSESIILAFTGKWSNLTVIFKVELPRFEDLVFTSDKSRSTEMQDTYSVSLEPDGMLYTVSWCSIVSNLPLNFSLGKLTSSHRRLGVRLLCSVAYVVVPNAIVAARRSLRRIIIGHGT